jgi:hypothetical protein
MTKCFYLPMMILVVNAFSQAAETIKLPNRVGLNLNIGGGFESIAMFTTEDGEDSEISFGGGVGMGLLYGYEAADYLDLVVSLNYQFSELRPLLKNAEVIYDRLILSFTPSYIQSIDAENLMRLKFGAGIDYYSNGLLTIKGNKVPDGFNDEWDYKNAAGFHLSLLFEILNIDLLGSSTRFWSMAGGLKWYTIYYKFGSSKNGIYFPSDKKLSDPTGSGIDLLMGLYYNF